MLTITEPAMTAPVVESIVPPSSGARSGPAAHRWEYSNYASPAMHTMEETLQENTFYGHREFSTQLLFHPRT